MLFFPRHAMSLLAPRAAAVDEAHKALREADLELAAAAERKDRPAVEAALARCASADRRVRLALEAYHFYGEHLRRTLEDAERAA